MLLPWNTTMVLLAIAIATAIGIIVYLVVHDEPASQIDDDMAAIDAAMPPDTRSPSEMG